MQTATIRDALLGLHATGPDGFEGFIRDAYQEAIGAALRLLKSGQQGGADAVSGFHPEKFSVGIEAKRYRDTSTLKLDDLKAKLIDAATRTGAPIEVWILAASKEVSGDDIDILQQMGAREGVSVLALDWNSRSEHSLFSPLPLLLSLAPGAVCRHLGDDIAQSISEIRNLEGYETASKSLIEMLTQPDLGFESARVHVHDKIAATLTSRADSKTKFKTPVDLLDQTRLWAQRDGLCGQIDAWMSSSTQIPICAVVGEEGGGKTWLMFDWWRRVVRQEDAPLILWISARDIMSLDLLGILSLALAKWYPWRNESYWARRLSLWLTVHADGIDGPLIYLMIDGVNEGDAEQSTLEALVEVVSSEWRGKVAIILSDRPDHWSRRIVARSSIKPPPKQITVGSFTDVELDTLLKSYEKSRDEFSAEVLELIRWPAWFQVAADLFDQPNDWSAHSPELLMVRYWAHRLKERGRIENVDPVMFQSFLKQVGKRVAADWDAVHTFKRRQLQEFLIRDADTDEASIRNAMADIVEGRWLDQKSLHEFTIKDSVLPCAAALVLLEDIKGATTEAEADAVCERFLGPIDGRDIGVAILRSAVALAYMNEGGLASHTQRVLLLRWINARNFRNSDFQLLCQIGRTNISGFLLAAEEAWREKADSFTDELLIKSLVNIAGHPEGLNQVLAFLEKWANTYWPDPKDGQFIGYRPSNDERAKAHHATKKRFLELEQHDPELVRSLRCEENGDVASWISHRVWAVSSYLPRAIQKPIYRAWALTRAIMDRTNHFDALAWTLRLNHLDPVEAEKAILSLVKELQNLNSALTNKTAKWLLDGLGSPAAITQLIAMDEHSSIRRHRIQDFSVNTESGLIQFSETSPGEAPLLRQLSSVALDPSVHIGSEHRKRLENFAAGFPVEELGHGRDQTRADIILDEAEPALARWTPYPLFALYQRYLMTVSECDEKGLMGLGFNINELSFVIDKPTRRAISCRLVDRVNKAEGKELDQTSVDLWAGALFGCTSTEQQGVWQDVGAPASVSLNFEQILACPETADIERLEPHLSADADTNTLISWAGYLVCAGAINLPEKWEPIVRLFDHPDGIVRCLAIEIALQSEQSCLASNFRATNWKADSDHGWKENWLGSSLLVQSVQLDDFQEIVNRIDPQLTGALWQHLSFAESAAGPFLKFFETTIERELDPPKQRSIPEYHCSPTEALKRLFKLHPESVRRSVQQLFAKSKAFSLGASQWPRLELLQVLFDEDAPLAADLWVRLRKDLLDRSITDGSIDALIFEAPSSDHLKKCRETLLSEVNNDWELIQLAYFINQYDRVDWAISWIKSTLVGAGSKSPSEIARSIALAGLLDDSEEVKTLWNTELSCSPCEGWLQVVHEEAKKRVEQGWNTLDWLQRALDAKDDATFFASWRLFRTGIDERLLPLVGRRLSAALDSTDNRRRAFIRTDYPNLKNQSAKEKQRMQKNLFFFKKGFSQAYPWGT